MSMVFWEMTSGISFSILYHCLVRQPIIFASVYGACGRISHVLHVKWTLGDDFKFVSVFSAELGSTADTCTT